LCSLLFLFLWNWISHQRCIFRFSFIWNIHYLAI
jgi:hypothetical protein